MEYSSGSLAVLNAIKSVQEADESIWLDRAMLAVADLFPSSSLAWALHQQTVWGRERRRQVRLDTSPSLRYGTNLDDLVTAAETAASADGAGLVRETHVAKALAQSPQTLQHLGISPDALVELTTERDRPSAPEARPKRARVIGSAREELLDAVMQELELTHLLTQDERTGTVERKRTILNSQGHALADQEQAAVALVNGTPEAPVYLIFGQEDNLTVLGEVDHRGLILDAEQVRASQRRFDSRVQACVPPITVRWREIIEGGKRIWVACMLGRARGTAVRTSLGSYPYRSGEDTHYASPDQITAWQREPIDMPADERLAIPEAYRPQLRTEDSNVTNDGGRAQRKALANLSSAVVAFRSAPPTIPTSISGRKLDDWRPVFEPVVERFQTVTSHELV